MKKLKDYKKELPPKSQEKISRRVEEIKEEIEFQKEQYRKHRLAENQGDRRMKIWIVTESYNYTGVFCVESLHKTKAKAEKHCREDGFKWDSSQGLFCSEEYCRELECMEMDS